MKKILLLILLVSFTASMAHAQYRQKRKYSFSVSGGMATPIGKFNQGDMNDEETGFAMSGLTASASFALAVSPYVSLGASLHGRSNPFDAEQFATASGMNTAAGEQVSAGAWQAAYLLADVYGNLPVSRDVTLFAKGSSGMAYAQFPDITQHYEGSTWQYTGSRAASPAYGLAGGFFYRISSVQLGFESGVLFNKTEFKVTSDGDAFYATHPLHVVTSKLSVSYSL